MPEANRASRRKQECPSCRERALVPILYGPLPESLSEDRRRGDFYWGGLSMKRGSPRWKCGSCQESFPADAV
jgi:hypothetical protein